MDVRKSFSKESVNSTKRASVIAARDVVPEQVRRQWQTTFQAFDMKHTGHIDVEELTAMMTNMQMVPQPGEVQAMIEAVDHDGDGQVSYDEFELMLVSAGRGRSIGFANIVERFVKMPEVAKLISQECKAFADQFMRTHVEHFKELNESNATEKRQAWLDVYRKFLVESELFLENALVSWGVNAQCKFEDTFLDAAQNTKLLDGFLSATEYNSFMRQMGTCVNQHSLSAKLPPDAITNGEQEIGLQDQERLKDLNGDSRPGTANTKNRLTSIDRELAQLDATRNALLAERRRLIGFEVTPITTVALKRELEMRNWKDEVGMD